MEFLGTLWNEVFLRPMINSLVVLYVILFHNFGLSIIVFTLLVRLATMPLTLKQTRQAKGMAQLQPKIKELQEKYRNDRQKVSQETMRLYKQQGVNPLGCLGPMVIQFPIWIGLYQALIQVLPTTPDAVSGLSRQLYSWLGIAHGAVPLQDNFLWLDLAVPDFTPVMPLLVGASMWVQQKMMTMPTTDRKQAQTNTMMLWMMPLMFMFFTFSFPSGLALYWSVSNIAGIVIQYFVTGWGGLLPQKRTQAETGTPDNTPIPALAPPDKESQSDGQRRSNGQDSRRGDRARLKAAGRKARRGHYRGRKPR